MADNTIWELIAFLWQPFMAAHKPTDIMLVTCITAFETQCIPIDPRTSPTDATQTFLLILFSIVIIELLIFQV